MLASPSQRLLVPPSKASSIRSGASTPQPPPRSAPGTELPQSNSRALTSRLRHLVDNPSRTATFVVNVTIHELSNIPQLNGKFACRWKFRGHKPSNGDRLLEHPEHRIPMPAARNVVNPTLRHSNSMMSLRTLQQGSGASTPSLMSASAKQRSLNVLAPTVPAPYFPQRPHSQHTLPASVVSRTAKLSTNANPSNGSPLHSKEASAGSGATATTGTASTFSVALDDAADVDSIVEDGAWQPPSSSQSTYSLNSAITKPGGLPVPGASSGPRSGSRSGTAPAAFGEDDQASAVPSRAGSVYSVGSAGPPASIASGAPSNAFAPDSTERRGMTPIEKIHGHAVQWEYDVQYVIRIPLGKPVPVADRGKARQPSPTRRGRTLPILGEGAMSHSGLKLWIEELHDGNDSHPRPFGYVNIDLAPFAELGCTARKFLLMDSKTNATIRISVDMRFIGGQQQWVTPPLTEGHFVADISQLTGDDGNIYKELQLLPTVSRSSDSATSSSMSGRPSNRSANSEISLTCPVSNANPVVSQQARNRYKSYEHHLRPEARTARREDSLLGDFNPRPYSANSTATGHSLGAFGMTGTESTTSSARTDSSSLPPRPILATQFLHMSPASSPMVERSPEGFFDNSPSRDLTLESPTTFMKGMSMSEEPLSPNEVSLTSPVLAPLSPDQSPPSLGLTRHVRHHSSHRQFLRDHRGHSDDLQADLVIEHVFNPRAAEEVGPFTFVPNEEDVDDMYEDELDGLQLEAEPETPVHHRRWSRIRRRVISSTHRNRTALENGGVSSAVY